MKYIEEDAFNNTSLYYVAVEEGCPVSVRNVVRRNVRIDTVRSVMIPYGTWVINPNQFKGQNVYRVWIPGSVEEIRDGAFADCAYLEEVVFEGGSVLRKIGQHAFCGCTNLMSISLPPRL